MYCNRSLVTKLFSTGFFQNLFYYVDVAGPAILLPDLDPPFHISKISIRSDPIPNNEQSMKKCELPVMVLTTGVTATAGMLPVLPDTTVTMGNVTAQLSGLLLARRHFYV
jgi:hypothetical protein